MTKYQAEYTVRDGDTLAIVCRMYYGNLDKLQEICDLNGITDPNTILPGQKIVFAVKRIRNVKGMVDYPMPFKL